MKVKIFNLDLNADQFKRREAMMWWNVLTPAYKEELADTYFQRSPKTLTDKEIHTIFNIEMTPNS